MLVLGFAMSLLEHLKQIPDYRTHRVAYPLWVILLLVILATMSGCIGYRAMEDFALRHQTELLKLLEIPCQRLPSDTTIRRVLLRVRMECLTHAFNTWMKTEQPSRPGTQVAGDGKSIKVSVQDYDQSYQDFLSIVSLFEVERGVVVGLQPMHNRKQSEIVTLRDLLTLLELTDVCVTGDALHAQKKRWKLSEHRTMTT
jgi:DDE_Tnp_1-associated